MKCTLYHVRREMYVAQLFVAASAASGCAFWRSGCTSSFLRCIFRLVFDIVD